MEIGFIHFGADERNTLIKVLQAIRDHHAIDELGIGRIRDAFSNLMFPGMSVLQNRAKYFALLPALYCEVEKGNYRNIEEVRRRVLDLEIKVTRQLLLGTDSAESRYGITGSTVIDRAEHNSAHYVKYDPTYIYWSGLVTYGMVRSDGYVYRLIYERSCKAKEYAAKHRTTESEELSDSDDLRGTIQLFDTGGLNYNFDGKTPIDIRLTKQEALFIKERIERSESSRESLLAYLLGTDVPIVKDYQDLAQVWHGIPEHFRYVYGLSALFSRFVYLLRIYYNYLYDNRTGNPQEAEKQLTAYHNYRENHSEITELAIKEVIRFVDKNVNDMVVKKFCIDAARCVEQGNVKELDTIITCREKATKGYTRAKLTNCQKYWNIPHTEALLLDFRWALVYQMIMEIREGIGDGR